MTSRSWRFACLLLVAASLGGCATLPDDAPVLEQLDEETGLTMARLGRPLELYRENFRKDTLGKFAFLAPFETNQMGRRELYLWVALPLEDDTAAVKPLLAVDGTTLALPDPGRGPDAAGLQHAPYKIPMSWIASFYYRIGPDTVARLGAATDLSIRVTEETRSGPLETVYALQVGDDPRLKAFASR